MVMPLFGSLSATFPAEGQAAAAGRVIPQSQIEQLSQENAALRNQNQQLTDTNAALQNRIQQLTDSNAALESRIQQLTQGTTQGNAAFQSRIQQLTDTNAALQSRIQQLTQGVAQRNAALQSRIQQLTDTNAAFQSRIQQLTKDDTALRNRNQQLEDQDKRANNVRIPVVWIWPLVALVALALIGAAAPLAQEVQRRRYDFPKQVRLEGRKHSPRFSLDARKGHVVNGEVELRPIRSVANQKLKVSGRLVRYDRKLS